MLNLLVTFFRYRKGDKRVAIACFLISSFFWIAQKLSREYNVLISIPVKYTINKNVTPVNELPQEIYAEVSSNGWMLLINKLFFLFYPLELSINGINITNEFLSENIEKRLLEAKLLSIKNDLKLFLMDELQSKDLFLKLDYSQVRIKKGCSIARVSFRPEYITVTGVSKIIRELNDTLVLPMDSVFIEKSFTQFHSLSSLLKNIKHSSSHGVFARIELECNE